MCFSSAAPTCSLDCHAAPSLQRDELLLVRRNPCLPRRLRGTRFGRLNPRLPSHTFKFEIRKTVVARESFLSESFQIFFPNPPFAGFNQLCCSGQQRRQSNATRYANPPRQSSESGRTFSECLHVTRSRPPAMYQLRARSAYKPVWADAGRRAAVARRRHVGAAAHVQLHCTGAVCHGDTAVGRRIPPPLSARTKSHTRSIRSYPTMQALPSGSRQHGIRL